MWALYLEFLGFTIGLSNLIVLALVMLTGHSPTARDLLIPAVPQFLLISLVFVLRALLRLHDAHVVERSVNQRTLAQLALKRALRSSGGDGYNFSRGYEIWNS